MSTSAFKKLVLFLSLFLFGFLANASGRAGYIMSFENSVEVFVNPTKKAKAGKNQVKFKDSYYKSKSAKVGHKLDWKDVVKTGPDGKVRISFKNGDTINVGPGTAYYLEKPSKAKKTDKKKSSVMNLLYGKVRAVVSKKGPRNNLRVKTKSSVAGVRGTDFVVSYQPKETKTKLFVLRGAVEVQPKAKKAKAVTIQKGQVAEVHDAPEVKKGEDSQAAIVEDKPVEIKPITKESLVEIQKDSDVKMDEKKMAEVPMEIKKEIKAMEEASAKVVLDDIKQDDKVLYEKITKNKDQGSMDVAALNSVVVGKLFKEAPKEKVKAKMSEEDMKDLVNEDVYKKYFNY